MISYYEVLGVTPEASIPELKQAYKLKLLTSHPDKIDNSSAQVDIPLIKQAFATLVDQHLENNMTNNSLNHQN